MFSTGVTPTATTRQQLGEISDEPPVAPTTGHQADLPSALRGKDGPRRQLPHREPLRSLFRHVML